MLAWSTIAESDDTKLWRPMPQTAAMAYPGPYWPMVFAVPLGFLTLPTFCSRPPSARPTFDQAAAASSATIFAACRRAGRPTATLDLTIAAPGVTRNASGFEECEIAPLPGVRL
jgi:ABC-type phosphate/phosphonate transport system permease subunit